MIQRTPLVYKEGYKYRISKRFCVSTILRPEYRVEIPGYVLLDTDGDLYIESSYNWDGPSGPTYDFESDMAASLVHDALYQLLIEGGLDKALKPQADRMLRDLMIEDGAAVWRALIYEKAVNKFGKDYLIPKEEITINPKCAS